MRRTNFLSARGVSTVTKAGYHLDGAGLYLQVTDTGAKSWIFRYTLAGRSREMGLGPVSVVPLAQARSRALECRKLLHEKRDPLEERRAAEAAARMAAAKTMTFMECADAYLSAHSARWKNAKHAKQWASTLKTYAERPIGGTAVQAIDTDLVMSVLEPIWKTKTETASRLRGRIEAVFDWARVSGFRTGENPARWKGHLDHLLPRRSQVQPVSHHSALPYAESPGFIVKLRAEEGIAARALEFAIMTVARTSEVIEARWQEFDLKKRLWTIPGARMKAGREHRVALSSQVVAVLANAESMASSAFVFPGMRAGKPLSNMALLALLKRMGRKDLTAHGFRSTFRDWAAEQTNYPSEVVEMVLAHTVSDKVEAAYLRSDMFPKRLALMQDWATFADGAGGDG